ncbi:MAG: hypothetical protein RLZZ227_315 [Pseudomonadota bacterium]
MNDMQSNAARPLISLGMPVRNEAAFLESALQSLLAQTGVDIELIISDNESTDATAEICAHYAQKDARIRYHRFEHNAGVIGNFRFVLQQAKGDYFMWASGHDVWGTDYLQRCALALHENPGAMIAFGTPHWIGPDGALLARRWGWSDTRGLSVPGRYFTVFWGHMNPVVGLIRTRELQALRVDDIVGLDLALLLALAMHGDFVHVPGTNWCRRDVRSEMSYRQKLERYRSKDYALDTSWIGQHFPLLRLPLRLLRDVCKSGLSARSRFQIIALLLVSLPLKYWVERTLKSANAVAQVRALSSEVETGDAPPYDDRA